MSTGNGKHTNPVTDELHWAPVMGRWHDGTPVRYQGQGAEAVSHDQTFPVGLNVSNRTLKSGQASVEVVFKKAFGELHQTAGLVIGYHSPDARYVMGQLGAAQTAYSVGEHMPAFGWRTLVGAGSALNLVHDRPYVLTLDLSGQRLRMSVAGVPVIEHLLARPLDGSQVGLIAAGSGEIEFRDFRISPSKPKAFVAMKFDEPYDTFYREVIRKQAESLGLDVVRIDEKAGPGVIFQDIQREIEQSDVVIAEITPQNVNVFYELGYAHALGKPTILLAQRGAELPFDIRSYRVVFYNDTIGGKPEVERNLNRHLEAVLRT